MAFQVRPLEPRDHAGWDAFVEAHPHGSPFHLLAWKNAIESSFPYRPYYLLAEEDGSPGAILPLFLVENPILGRVLLSSPFAVYGGVLARSDAALAAMKDHVSGLAAKLEVQYLELRNAFPEQSLDFKRNTHYVTFTQETALTDPEQLLAALPKKTRNLVRKSLKFPYSTRFSTDLSAFYDLMARNYRRLGTPIFPRRFFQALLENFGPRIDLREILLEGKVAAASLNFLFRSEMHTYYAASDQSRLHAAPNNYMYFDYLLWAARAGLRRFDFGRSKLDTGTFEFKRHWLTEMRELPYEVLLVKRTDLPNFSPKNPKFDLALKVWRRLPLPVTRILGPRLIGLFP
jgi:FemAB-related protein (PEP-CTERM system-associated)